FRDGLVPVTALPDGSGPASGTLGPQDTIAWGTAGNYQHTFSDHWFNELRVGDTRRTVERTAVDLPNYQISGYQQLGSPPNTASDFGTSVTEVADSLSWLTGPHSFKAGFDLRWPRLDVVQ